MKTWRCYSVLLLGALFFLLGSEVSHAQVSDEDQLTGCDDKDVRDRSRSTRRRSGGSNRDCEYRETVVDETTAEVLQKTPVSLQRSVMPRRYSSTPRPTAEQYVEAVPMPDRWRIVEKP